MLIGSLGRNHSVYADAQFTGTPVEMASVEQQKSRLILASGDNLIDTTRSTIVEAKEWLPFFAERYNISADVRDYVVVPVVIMPSDLPNRNVVAFPYDELVKANPDVGQLGYQTWRAKPMFADHCFPGNAPIQTKGGHKRIKKIKVGDVVLTHQHRWKPVTQVFNNGKKWLSEIKITGMAESMLSLKIIRCG
jgi:hypothetical protein